MKSMEYVRSARKCRIAGIGLCQVQGRMGWDTSLFLYFVFGMMQLYSSALRGLAVVDGRYCGFCRYGGLVACSLLEGESGPQFESADELGAVPFGRRQV